MNDRTPCQLLARRGPVLPGAAQAIEAGLRHLLGTARPPRASFRRKERNLDESEVRAFLAEEYGRVVAVVALASGDLAAAEDAVSEALARAWERSERGEYIESVGAWVTTVAMNLTRSRWRRLLTERRARSKMTVSEEGLEPDVSIDLQRALEALPRPHREVVLLHHYLGFDVEAVARQLGVRPGTVKSRLHRARAGLAGALRTEGEEHVRPG